MSEPSIIERHAVRAILLTRAHEVLLLLRITGLRRAVLDRARRRAGTG
jgi:hypothetical protein